MNATETRSNIIEKLALCAGGNLASGAVELLGALGYRSDKTAPLQPNSAGELLARYGQGKNFNADKALIDQWQSVDLLFQITDEEISAGGQLAFAATGEAFNNQIIQSYLFFAIELEPRLKPYTRTELSQITREVNKLFFMPALILFRHGENLTFAIIDRRLSKKNAEKDVLQKVTLIKDIRAGFPHRAHVEILFDLSLQRLHQVHGFRDFVELHAAWRKTLDASALNNRFYKELADWYFWAVGQVRFPDPPLVDGKPLMSDEQNRATNVIRLITRLMFCWFIKEKGSATKKLVPEPLFDEKLLRGEILRDWQDDDSSFYKAILQNLFFATLNTEMNDPKRPRRFQAEAFQGKNKDREIPNVYRYKAMFQDPDAALALFRDIPFLNGGLFECLDIEEDPEKGIPRQLIDGFSSGKNNPLHVPNFLFFADAHEVDLSGADAYNDSKKKNVSVRGLIGILKSYKFTVEENTPIEEEIALDPELLGQVFENLLAAFVEETKVTARKQTGSFYTPRGVVEYMVDESLVAAFTPKLEGIAGHSQNQNIADELRALLSYQETQEGAGTGKRHAFSDEESAVLIEAIDELQVLDPACGSGAFPMGLLHKLVLILGKLDPENRRWKEQQLQRAQRDLKRAQDMEDETLRDKAVPDAKARIEEIRASFENPNHELDYLRKLYLIENSIYGVDFQPIAMQIAKLRFFISLVIDQQIDDSAPNRGIRPLPNLETKFVAANSLMSVPRPAQAKLRNLEIDEKLAELKRVRERHFLARGRDTKRKCREDDKRLREELAALLEQEEWDKEVAQQLAHWNPYDQNQAAPFFDAWWMFGLESGFDIVIANPPYVRQEQIKEHKPAFEARYSSYTGMADLYVYFYESAFRALQDGGVLCFISSNKYFRAGYGAKLRALLAKHGRVLQLIDFGDAPVFTAIAYPSILLARRHSAPPAVSQSKGKSAKTNGKSNGKSNAQSDDLSALNNHTFRALPWQEGPTIEEFPAIFRENSFEMPQSELAAEDGWRLEPPEVLALLKTLRGRGTRLGDYVKGRFYYGIKTGLQKAFVVDRETRDRLIAEDASSAELLKPFLRGRDVKRWKAEPQDLWLIFTRQGTQISDYPAIENYLSDFKEELMPGVSGGRKAGSYEWFEIQDNIAYWQEFEEPKIILGRFMNKATFAFDDEGFYHNDALYMIAGATKYVVAVLNSSTSWWFLTQTCTDLQNEYLQAYRENLFQIPIPHATPAQQGAIETLVDYILWLKSAEQTAQQTANTRDPLMLAFWEQLIDALVYELFLPDELHAAGKKFFDLLQDAQLPRLNEIEDDKLQTLRAHFERLFEREHPLRQAVFFLDSVESVRLIEGKNQEPVSSSGSSSSSSSSHAAEGLA